VTTGSSVFSTLLFHQLIPPREVLRSNLAPDRQYQRTTTTSVSGVIILSRPCIPTFQGSVLVSLLFIMYSRVRTATLGGLSKICRDAGTVRQRRKTPRLAPGQVCDAGTDVGTDCQHLTRRLSLHTQSQTPGQVNSDRHAS